ncbi:MAG: hypothetical protein ACLGPL_08315 [Acidobacteriota bacterium]
MKSGRFCVVLLAAALVVQPMLAMAGSPGRIIPNGTVNLDGKQFKSEMPLREGVLMACSGNCIVQTQNIQLVAQNQALFALTNGAEQSDLTVKSGQVNFAIRGEASPVAFHTPHDVVRAEQIVVPAASNGAVRGSVTVSDAATEIAVTEGALQVVSSNGTQLVQPGNSIVLAQAKVADDKESKDKKKAGAAVVGSGTAAGTTTAAAAATTGSIAGISTTTMVVGGVVAAGTVGGIAAAASTSSDSSAPASASAPAPISPF